MTEQASELIDAVRREAERVGSPIDTEVYARSGRDPKLPIMFASALDAPFCIVGRDLGRDEVRAGQPLIEDFEWFAPYAEETAFQTDGATATRFEKSFRCLLPGNRYKGGCNDKTLLVYPLPHPSPLNRRWFSRFPVMLARRLDEV